jgi:hypothetical protein
VIFLPTWINPCRCPKNFQNSSAIYGEGSSCARTAADIQANRVVERWKLRLVQVHTTMIAHIPIS